MKSLLPPSHVDTHLAKVAGVWHVDNTLALKFEASQEGMVLERW